MVLALLGFSGIDTCAKWLVLDGVPTPEVVFMRYAVHLALVVALALPGGEPWVRTGNPGAVTLRGLFLLGSTVLNFWALGTLPLTTTSAIMFTGPLWVCMLSIPLLGEPVGAAPLGGDPGRLRRRPRGDPAVVGDGALGGARCRWARRSAARSTPSSPAASPAATAPRPSSSTPASWPASAWPRSRSPTGPGRPTR